MIMLDDTAVTLSISRLVADEGFRSHVYTDTAGHPTIGYGLNLDAGISEAAARALLTYQVKDLQAALAVFWWWDKLDPVRASVIVQMAFNLGPLGLLHFPKMLTAIGAQDWKTAAAELLDSEAARQLPVRYAHLAQTLATGEA